MANKDTMPFDNIMLDLPEHFSTVVQTITVWAHVLSMNFDSELIGQFMENLQTSWIMNMDTIRQKWSSVVAFAAFEDTPVDMFPFEILSKKEIEEKMKQNIVPQDFLFEWLTFMDVLCSLMSHSLTEYDDKLGEIEKSWRQNRLQCLNLWQNALTSFWDTEDMAIHNLSLSEPFDSRHEAPSVPVKRPRHRFTHEIDHDKPSPHLLEMPEPVQFIYMDHNGKWAVSQEAVDILRNISSPISAVAVVGKYRTGKSYLMNRLAGGGSGFGLGSTIQSKTKGIWIWAHPHPEEKDTCLLLLDTEGLYDVEKGDTTHDVQLFTFAVLLSNCLVFNAVGVIDDALVQQLHLVSELTDNIKVKKTADDKEYGAYFASYFPSLFIVLRDFFLQLIKDEKEITADEYLEGALKLKRGRSPKDQAYNAPRDSIRKFFPKRTCYVIPKPVADDTLLQNIEIHPDTKLRPEFLEKCAIATAGILTEAKPMSVDGNTVYGPGFLELSREYVRCINDGGVPCIESAIVVMKDNECRRACENSLVIYKEDVEVALEFNMPVETAKLDDIHKEAKQNAIDAYRKFNVFDEDGKYPNMLERDIEEAFKQTTEENNRTSSEKCKATLRDCFAELEQKIKNGTFTRAGGHAEYLRCQEAAVTEYKRSCSMGPMKDATLHEFLTEKRNVEESIIVSDKRLTEKEQNEAMLQLNLKNREKQLEIELAASKRLREENMRQEKEHNEMVMKLQKDFEAKQERLLQENRRNIAAKEQEHKRLLQDGLHEQAEAHKRILSQLQRDRQEKESQLAQNRAKLQDFQMEMRKLEQHMRDRESAHQRDMTMMQNNLNQIHQRNDAERQRIQAAIRQKEREHSEHMAEMQRRKQDSDCVIL